MTTALTPTGHRRLVSGIERAWVVAHDLFAPFNNQMVLEGDGALDGQALRNAVETATLANPGARVIRRGWVGWTHWDDRGPPPPVVEVDGSGWDGLSGDGAPWLARPLDPHRGPTTEVVLMHGPTPRVAFRTAHATMDGRGTQLFAEDVFRALRGEPCVGHADPVVDMDLVRRVEVAPMTPPEDVWLPATGLPEGPARGVRWLRRSLPGAHRAVLGRVAHTVAAHARRHHGPDAPLRFDIPADLRGLAPEVRSTANLTGMVSLSPAPDDTVESLTQRVRDAVAAHEHAASLLPADGLRHVPLWLMRAVARHRGRQHHTTGRYGSTGVLSNLGRVDLSPLHGGGFTARRVLFIPPGTPVTALFMAMVGHPEGVELLASVPDNLATGGRLEALMDDLVAAFDG